MCQPARSSSRTAWAPRATVLRDLVEMELHGFGVGVGHGESRAGAARRADGAEQVGALVALIGRLARARCRACPLPHDPVLLADAGFVLEPDLDRLALRQAGEMAFSVAAKFF